MKKALLLLLLFAAFGSLKAQDTLQERKSIVTVSLFSPTVSYAPRYNIGYMHKVSRRWWAGIEAGYGNYGTAFGIGAEGGSDYITNDYKLFEVRPEIYFDLRPSSKLKHLVSAEFFYINHKDHFTTDRYYAPDGFTEYKYDAADYKRIKTGVNLNYSLMFYFTNRFGLLWKTGLGIANRTVKYSNLVNKVLLPNDNDEEWFGIDGYLEDSGTVNKFNFNQDLKLFYKF
ncbi:hypothetical protein Q765_14785 [Flavobacterium rivuli WB 3.3-2 = DSM 21788]|uniref:Outer membrane protein beta-barrel domain-containing protein n=1 Tax=Flavobacterium rivuli WB 3.3-2 = DSM 21788 TaxID=1121895 RepID=A0A0A2LZB8_9FLAO|nr:hypothetical protein [Flavobacterium rivuli]KGO85687.1 hypothetical protein Q765_14785 [Flavobacterium rivuli WB 3.3-2 = DSM 21788]